MYSVKCAKGIFIRVIDDRRRKGQKDKNINGQKVKKKDKRTY